MRVYLYVCEYYCVYGYCVYDVCDSRSMQITVYRVHVEVREHQLGVSSLLLPWELGFELRVSGLHS